ncbi:hypothetical protein V6N13_117227 [Hibiscus sabdariffa]|uniref:NAC domain-containing protein n=1 Tax=Hibiscus sabdariffa TaxID=183260 RepID=A0ABR2PAC5_9ROSI
MVQNFSGAASHVDTNTGGGGKILRTSGRVVNGDYFWWGSLGFRFVPTDVELIRDYLMKKVKGEPLPPNPNFHEANIYDTNPDQLSQEYKQSDGGKEWYFFSSRNRKYPKGWRPNRETGNRVGFWKVTGVTKPVTDRGGGIIGYKSNLDFYLRRDPKNKKTNWKMHEYQVKQNKSNSIQGMMLDKCVLCKIYLTRTKKGTGKETESEEDHCSDACSSLQDANGPPSSAINSDMVDATTSIATPLSIQIPDVSFSPQDYRGMYAMKGWNYNEGAMNLAPQSSWNIMPTYGSYNQYSNASFSQLPPDGACLMPDSSENGVAGSSSMAGINNMMYASQNHFMGGYSQQVVNGASPMAASYVQGMIEAPLMPGINNSMYAPVPACPIPDPMAGSYQQAINGAPLMAGESNSVSASQNPLMEIVTACTTPNAYGQVLNGAPSMSADNNTVYASQNPLMAMGTSVQNPNASIQAVTTDTATQFQQDFIGASSMGDSLQNTEQAVNFMAGNMDTLPTYVLAPEYQNLNDCPFQNDFHGAFSMDGFNENHWYSWDSYPEPLPAENFNGNNNFLQVQYPNATSFGPTFDDRAMNIEGWLEGCNSVTTHPHDNVQQPNTTPSQPTVSDKSGNEKGSAGRNSNPLATQPEDGNEGEEADENSGSAT